MIPKQRKFTIGRDRSCDIALAHDTVSRQHAEIAFIEDGKLLLTDCNSTSGTFLVLGDSNDRPLRQELVSPMDRVRFGDVQIPIRDLIEALKLKFPRFETPTSEPTIVPPPTPKVQGHHLVRCLCGCIKPVSGACPGCGR